MLAQEPSEIHMDLDDLNAVDLQDLRKVKAFNFNFPFKKEHGIIFNKLLKRFGKLLLVKQLKWCVGSLVHALSLALLPARVKANVYPTAMKCQGCAILQVSTCVNPLNTH